jgi:hypothetical protein
MQLKENIFRTLIFFARIILMVKSMVFDKLADLVIFVLDFPFKCLQSFSDFLAVLRAVRDYVRKNYKRLLKDAAWTLFYVSITLFFGSLIWTATRHCRELATVFFPLFDAVFYGFSLFLYRKNLISRTGIHYFWGLSLGLNVLFGFSLVWNYIKTQQVVYISCFTWLKTTNFQIDWGFLFDALTINMIFVVLFVSALVKIYSWGYMQQDPHQLRFFSYLSLFTFFMLILVTADNFI